MLPAIRNFGSDMTSWAPTNRLSTVIDRFFDDPFFGTVMAPAPTALPLAMWEDEQTVYVEVDAPGVAGEDVDVSVHEGTLIIQGERKSENKGNGYDARTYGRFEQRLALPCQVDTGKVEAKLANGVLTLTCPKSEAAKPRKIAISRE